MSSHQYLQFLFNTVNLILAFLSSLTVRNLTPIILNMFTYLLSLSPPHPPPHMQPIFCCCCCCVCGCLPHLTWPLTLLLSLLTLQMPPHLAWVLTQHWVPPLTPWHGLLSLCLVLSFESIYLFIYLIGCTGSLLWLQGSLVVACWFLSCGRRAP